MRKSVTDIAVIIPARNEEDRIAACLSALAAQCTARVTIILVVNNTHDRTADVARDTARLHGLHLVTLERSLAAEQGVGTARRIGCNNALRNMPDLRYILTTDADCIVGPDWIARNCEHLQHVDAVCGKVDLITAETGNLDGMDRHLATLEGTYRTLVQQLFARHAPGCADIDATHGEAAGASLAFTTEAYLAVGGFSTVKCGEDRRIARALRDAGRKVRHADDVTVQASCRLSGRAAGGMADALKARINGEDYMIDDCLPPADWMIDRVARKTLGPWPAHVPAEFRLKVRDLPHHIRMLKDFENSEGRMLAPIGPVAAASWSHPDVQQPAKGSAIVPADPDVQSVLPAKDRISAISQLNMSALSAAKGA